MTAEMDREDAEAEFDAALLMLENAERYIRLAIKALRRDGGVSSTVEAWIDDAILELGGKVQR